MIIKFLLDLREKGWTQEAIAEKAGITQAMVSKIYRGKTCTLETVVKIADGFKVPVDFILGRSPERKGGNNYHGEERRKASDRYPPGRKQTAETAK